MGELVQAHLDTLAIRLGAFLRGFDDPTVHVGTPALFAREMMRLFERPALRVSGSEMPISYAQALGCCRAPALSTEALEPVAILARGLGGPMTRASAPRQALALDTLREDLARLLRVPVLRFYLAVTDRDAFVAAVNDIAAREGVTLDAVSASGQGREDVETLAPLPMVSAVAATVSYELLRHALDLDLVETWQEEGHIHPIAAARAES